MWWQLLACLGVMAFFCLMLIAEDLLTQKKKKKP